MVHRAYFLLGGAFLVSAGAIGLACSSDNTVVNPGGDDGGSESSTSDEGGTGDSGSKDSGKDASVAVCTTNPIQGACDLVSQNCPNNQECVSVVEKDGGASTVCQAKGTGALKEG